MRYVLHIKTVCLYSCLHLFCATLCCHLRLIWLYHIFPHYLKNGMIFGKKFFFFFFLSINLLIGWQLSIWNCCKPFFSLLYNCQLLCFWRTALSIVVEVYPRPFFRILLLQYTYMYMYMYIYIYI